MSTRKEFISVKCSKGFVYNVLLEHKPHWGFTSAIYNDDIISQVELGRIREPIGDNDREWEMYEDRYSEWRDEIVDIMQRTCKNHFDSKNQ